MKASRLHLVLLLLWTVLAVPTVLWWRESIFWVSFMSWYAIVVTHAGSYEAAKAKEAVKE